MTPFPEQQPIQVRSHGSSGPPVVVLHGGPGAPGSAAPLARGLGDAFRVLEPLQRTSDSGPLTVQQHIDDLREAICDWCCGSVPALVGHSWGAMLALAYAAQFPDTVSSVVLVGCGTFDPESRAALQRTVNERATADFNARAARVLRGITDPDVRMCVLARQLDPLYTFDVVTENDETEDYDSNGFRQTWQDMVRLQEQGVYPQSFAVISAPVLMLHGSFDPHPGRMTYETLSTHIPQLQYVEFRDCGHYPWRERRAREEFYRRLRTWLMAHVA